MWILNQVTENLNVGDIWNLCLYGLETKVNGRLFTDVKRAERLVAADDNPMKLMSIAMKPLGQPPFPIERIEEMTRMMGGEGSL